MSDSQSDSQWTPVQYFPVLLITVGIGLIAASLLPLEWAAERLWTTSDSEQFDRISLEYHQSAFQTPGRAGRTKEEMRTYRENLESQFELMREKLQVAQAQPKLLRRYLLWSGGAFAAMGFLAHLASGK